MELNVQELLREYSEQEGKNEEAVYNDEIRAELDADTLEFCLCCIRCCC